MSPNPETFLTHLRQFGYHPRSDKHSNSFAEAITHDLITYCPRIRQKAATGEVVYFLNFTLRACTAEWNVDLVLGPPELGVPPPTPDFPILCQPPSTVEIAIEIKSIMTEHHKAVKNRKRDLEAHHEHVHNYSAQTIAGGVFIVNAAASFRSPLRSDLTTHSNPKRLVKHCVDELRSVATRGGATGYGLEAKCAVIVDIDNISSAHASFLTALPAPAVGDPLHYDAFIQTLCRHYTRRF